MPNIYTLKIEGLHHDNALLANLPPQRKAWVSSQEVLQGAIEMYYISSQRKNNAIMSQQDRLLCALGGRRMTQNLLAVRVETYVP